MSDPDSENRDEQVLAIIAKGLRSQPSYLLMFGVIALFTLSGFLTTTVGLARDSLSLIGFGLGSLVFSLLAAFFTIREIDGLNSRLQTLDDLSEPYDSALPVGDSRATATHPTIGLGGKRILETYPASIEAELAGARDTLLVGVHQSHILIRFHEIIEEKLRNGDRFRILLLDPNGYGVAMTTMRFPGGRKPSQEYERIVSTIDSFRKLAEETGGAIEIRTIDFLFPYGGFAFDLNSLKGSIYLQQYTFRVHGGPRKPKFVLRNEDNDWYDLAAAELSALWDAASPLPEGIESMADVRRFDREDRQTSQLAIRKEE